jgi:hypothetical protein
MEAAAAQEFLEQIVCAGQLACGPRAVGMYLTTVAILMRITKDLDMQVTKAEGVCVVVSRWFGGVHLGPSRFSIINNTARQLLVAEGYIQAGSSGKPQRRNAR